MLLLLLLLLLLKQQFGAKKIKNNIEEQFRVEKIFGNNFVKMLMYKLVMMFLLREFDEVHGAVLQFHVGEIHADDVAQFVEWLIETNDDCLRWARNIERYNRGRHDETIIARFMIRSSRFLEDPRDPEKMITLTWAPKK